MIMSKLWIPLKKTLFSITNGQYVLLLFLCITASFIETTIFTYAANYLINLIKIEPNPKVDKIIAIIKSGGGYPIWLFFPSILAIISFPLSPYIIKELNKKSDCPIPIKYEQPLLQNIKNGLTTSAKMLLINIIMLPCYLIPIASPILYFFINSYLIARFHLLQIAAYFCDRTKATSLFKPNRPAMLLYGLITLIVTIFPFASMFSSFIAISLMFNLINSLIEHRQD